MLPTPEPGAEHAEDVVLPLLVEARARALTAIPGCFQMEGRWSKTWSTGSFGSPHETAAVRGVLRDGVWERRELSPPDAPGAWFPARNLAQSAFGIDSGAGGAVGWGRYLMDALPGAVSTEYAERRGDDWALVQALAGDVGNTLTTVVDGTSHRVRSIDAHVDSPIRGLEDGGHPVRVLRLRMHVELGPDGAPRVEDVDARFAQGVLVGHTAVRQEWRSSPCAAEAPPAPVPPPGTTEAPR